MTVEVTHRTIISIRTILIAVALALALVASPAFGQSISTGDVNGDGNVDEMDFQYLLGYVFLGGLPLILQRPEI